MEDVAKYEVEKKEHWAEKHYNNLIKKEIEIHDKRYEDYVKRGELFALEDRITDVIFKKIEEGCKCK